MRPTTWLIGLVLFMVAGTSAAMAPIAQWTTSSGARVYFVPATEIPMLDVRLVFAAGSVRDGAAPGTSALTTSLLDEGTAARTADNFHAALETTGAAFGTGSSLETASVSLRTLSEATARDAALALVGELLHAPRFEAQAFERQRDLLISGLKQARESPGTLADEAFMRALYGGHPYGAPASGTLESAKALTLDTVQAFYNRHYVAANAIVLIVGDATREEAGKIADQLIANLAGGEAAPALPPAPLDRPRVEQHIEFNVSQTHVMLGQIGIPRGDPDHFALLLANHVLGGNGVVSRLFNEIREKRGLSYSVDSHFEPLGLPGPFVASLQTSGPQRDEAVALLKQEIADYVAKGPDPQALEEARRNLLGGFPLRIDNNAKILENVAMMATYGLPLDYLDTWRDKLRAVTLDQVKDALHRRLKPESMSVITVGRATTTPADGQ